eukprot:1486665-Pleurochrysis_carterae.AAC.1
METATTMCRSGARLLPGRTQRPGRRWPRRGLPTTSLRLRIVIGLLVHLPWCTATQMLHARARSGATRMMHHSQLGK